jgi:hypothetical protein
MELLRFLARVVAYGRHPAPRSSPPCLGTRADRETCRSALRKHKEQKDLFNFIADIGFATAEPAATSIELAMRAGVAVCSLLGSPAQDTERKGPELIRVSAPAHLGAAIDPHRPAGRLPGVVGQAVLVHTALSTRPAI